MLYLLFALLADISSMISYLKDRLEPPPIDYLIYYRIDSFILLVEAAWMDYIIDSFITDYPAIDYFIMDSPAIDSLIAD